MKNKRMKFSPNSIAEVEKQTIDRLVGTEDRYTIPAEFKGRVQTTWDTLVSAFLAPINYTRPSCTRQIGLNIPVFDCFLSPSIVTNAQQ